MLATKKPICVILALLFFAGCATFQIDTPEKKHLVARTEFNILLEKYISVQDMVSDEDHAIAKKAILSADASLDAWEEAVIQNPGYDYTFEYSVWIQAKESLLRIIRIFME